MATSSTLHLGDRAPEFSLRAANRDGTFSLQQLTGRSTLVLEFLRGTW